MPNGRYSAPRHSAAGRFAGSTCSSADLCRSHGIDSHKLVAPRNQQTLRDIGSMHIALYSPGWPIEKFENGVVTYVHWMKLEFEKHGHRVSVITDQLDPSASTEGIYPFRRRPLWGRLMRRAVAGLDSRRGSFDKWDLIAMEILRVHKLEPIDIIEMEESFGWSADVTRKTSIPAVVRLHGPSFLTFVGDESNSSFAREKIAREGFALAKAAGISAPSQVTLEKTLERYRLAPRIARHIVNPMTINGETPLWRLDACDRDTILFVGRFDLLKGADVALQAFSLLLKDRPKLKLIFVGPDKGLLGKDAKPIHFEKYCELFFPRSLRDRVEFLGRMPNRDIARLRTKSMMTIIPSRWETQGYTLLEAMIQGCPVISTDAGGHPETIKHGVTGRLAKSEDAHDFAVQISTMLDDPVGAERMGRAARRYVLDHHASARVASDTLEMYETILSTHSA